MGAQYVSAEAMSKYSPEELAARFFESVGCSADWVNDAFQVTPNLTIFDDTDVSGKWQVLAHALDPDEVRHQDITYSSEDLMDCIDICLQCRAIQFNCAQAVKRSVVLENVCVPHAYRWLQTAGLEPFDAPEA